MSFRGRNKDVCLDVEIASISAKPLAATRREPTVGVAAPDDVSQDSHNIHLVIEDHVLGAHQESWQDMDHHLAPYSIANV